MAAPRPRRRRWVRPAVAALPVVVLPAVGSGATAAGAAPDPGAGTAATPVLSLRRDPTWIETTLAAERLDGTLNGLIAGQVGGSTGVDACIEVSQGGQVLYALSPTLSLEPASNMKIETATAALERLGPDYHFTTTVTAGAAPAGGTVTGNLYLVGGGDPLLRTASFVAGLDPPQPTYTSLDQLASEVVAAGVHRITGNVVGDESRYDSLRSVPTWKATYLSEGDSAPLSALEVNDGIGIPAAATPPARTTTPTTAVPVPAAAGTEDPPLTAAAALLTLLRRDGVTVGGTAAVGTSPAGAPTVAQIPSPPLRAEVDNMLTVSDDTAAELLVKELGHVVSGQGTTAAGTAVVRSVLAGDGLPVPELDALDGSGLDTGDRATCDLVTATLERDGAGSVVYEGLPVAARTGTLLHRMAGTPAAGRLRAKTGTLDQVAALSGFVPSAGTAPVAPLDAPLVFSIIFDGRDFAASDAVIDRIGAALAAYPDVPPVAGLGPAR